VRRAACVGIPIGVFLAALVVAESGLMLGGAIAFVVTSVFYGTLMARRMARFWPAAQGLSGADRVAVVRAARRGRRVDDPHLAPAAAEYARGLSEARAQARQGRWVVWLAAAAMVVLAVLDISSASPRNVAVSWLFVVFFAVEILWWPRVQARLVVNAERTAQSSR
jgi:hypothetical protein